MDIVAAAECQERNIGNIERLAKTVARQAETAERQARIVERLFGEHS